MRFSSYTSAMTADAARLGQVAEDNMEVVVPTCPEWTVEDLVRHVAMVYAHKVQVLRLGRPPEPWPPESDDQAPPLTRLRTAMGELLAEFTARGPEEIGYSWYEPDQSVGFWMRRMSHETLIHRVDAELAAKVPVNPIGAERALDGIDELLVVCLGWASRQWIEEDREQIARLEERPIAVVAADRRWLLRPGPDGITVAERPDGEADVTIHGEPADVMLWLWRRVAVDAVDVDGDPELARALYELLPTYLA